MAVPNGTSTDKAADPLPGRPRRGLRPGRFPPDDLPEKIVAEAIVEHLELCGWRMQTSAQAQRDATSRTKCVNS